MGREGKGYHWQNPFEEIASIRASRERRRVMVVWSAATIRRDVVKLGARETFHLLPQLADRRRGGGGGTKSGELPSRSLSAHWRITNERAFKEIFCTFLLRSTKAKGGGWKVGMRWTEETSGGMIAAREGGKEGVVIVSGGGKRVKEQGFG